jgi:predicted nucleic acid-binding protein
MLKTMAVKWVKSTYFDASALARLVLEEANSAEIRKFVNEHTNLYTTSICNAEAFGVLKTRFVKSKVTVDEYYELVEKLTRAVRNKFTFNEEDLLKPTVRSRVTELGKKYKKLDMSDVLQLVTIQDGYFSKGAGGSKTLLVTADKNLAAAAVAENVRVWDCNLPLPVEAE